MCKARAVFNSHILSGSLSTAIFNYCSHTGWQCIRQNTRQEATLMKRFAFVCDWRKRPGGEGLKQEHVLVAPTTAALRKHRKGMWSTASLSPPVCLFRDLRAQGDATHIWGKTSPLRQSSLEIPSQTCSDMCLLLSLNPFTMTVNTEHHRGLC